MPTPNVDLLRRTLETVEAQPERWSQGDWRHKFADRCDTVMCFAGWACQLNGEVWADTVDPEAAETLVIVDGKFVPVGYRATEILGLRNDQADRLFYAEKEELSRQVRAIIAEAQVPVGA